MRRHETWIALLLLCALECSVDGLRGSELVKAARTKAAEEKLNPTTEEVTVLVAEDGTNTTVVNVKPLLTGIPQKDYIHDPNLPRELKGHNLTDYPFYNAVPPNIKFECDGLHDGFYASVLHKCQVYHHCLFGTRYDFLCANYTAFDQKTFICHFVSEVDCKNSPNYYNRNEALYKQDVTTAPSTTRATTLSTTTTTTTTTEAPPRKSSGGRRRRPYRRRRPVYEYYYDDEEEAYDEEYYDDDVEPPPRKANRRQQRPTGGKRDDPTTTSTTTTSTTTPAAPASADAPLTRAPLSVYAPRALPKIKRPVPINEKSKYDYTTKAGSGELAPTSDPREGEDEEYYYEDEEYDDAPQPPPSKRKESGKSGRRRTHHSDRKRPSRFEDEYEDEAEEEEDRMRTRKGNRKEDDYRHRNRGSQGKSKKGQREDEEAIPSERPGYITPPRGAARKRHQETSRPERRRPDRRPPKGYEYYDDEEVEDDASRFSDDRRRSNNRGKPDKPRGRPKMPTSTTTTTTSTTSTTTTTTTTPPPPPPPKSTSPPPKHYPEDDEEYEEYEYEDDIILDKGKDENRKEVSSTTPAPHRFSTTAYRNFRPSSTSTTEAAPRRSSSNVTFRPRKPEYNRRPPNSEELFSSQVGTPTGFKKSEEEPPRVKVFEPTSRRPFEDENQKSRSPDFPSRRPAGGLSFSPEENSNRRPTKPTEPPQTSTDIKPLSIRQDYSATPVDVKPQGESQGFFIRKPFKPQLPFNQNKFSDDVSQRRPDNFNLPPTAQASPTAEDDLSFRKQQTLDTKLSDLEDISLRPEDKKQRIDYSISAPQITQGPPLPSPPQSAVYRRPYVPTAPEGLRRPIDESQYRRQKPDSLPPSGEGSQRRPPFQPSSEGNVDKEEEQSYRRPQKSSYSPTGPDAFRRPSGPEGPALKPANYRRGRPSEKDTKKTLEELAYPSRRPAPTQESATEAGPNYRNPFLSSRPVVEEPDFYKSSKEPAVEFTAPGPSADASTRRPLSSFDIAEEYDVTLNDALQPSTLNPTVQYSRVKTRGYQSAVTHPSYRSLLIPAASQNYYSKAPVAGDQVEYETVVLPASRFAQARYKPRRPNDWYWK